MTVALCLQTCDRPELTAKTLETFAAHNDLSRFLCLHADDASQDDQNQRLAQAYGFTTAVQSTKRHGVRVIRTALIQAAAERRSNWVLVLENDIETLRPFPWELFHFARRQSEIYTLRLYGQFKDAARLDRCLDTHKRNGHHVVQWRPFRDAPEKSQIGRIHWSAQPAVTRMCDALSLHLTGQEPNGFTVRVKKNVTSHMGVERTPGRVL